MRDARTILRHGSLFSGIGGFDLAAEWMGWKNIFHCELNPFCQQVLRYHFPDALGYEDIKKTDFSKHKGGIDILTGGFPCQPYSLAGKRLGKADERHLWPDMLRAIREIRPQWVVAENVPGIISWNDGMVFEEVQLDLEAEGYQVQAFVLPAAGVNAPHRRDRVWFVAYSERYYDRWKKRGGDKETPPMAGKHGQDDRAPGKPGGTAFPDLQGHGQKQYDPFGAYAGIVIPDWESFPTQSPVCTGNDGLPLQLDGITFPKWRTESIKAGGNAIVPQVAYQLFRAITSTIHEHSKL